MIVLGFDSATQATAVALRLDDGSTRVARDDPPPDGHPGHARLLAMAASLLADAGVGWREVERIVAGIGPGRFTGLRVGVATARGLAQSLDAELVGVSSLRALGLAAARAGAGEPGGGPRSTGTLAVIDARRGEAFAAAFDAGTSFESSSCASPTGPLAGETEFPRPLRASQLADVVAELERHGAASGQRWRAVGDGALRFREELHDAGVEVLPVNSALHLVDPVAVCELGLLATPVAHREELLPDYRRSPDAALARAQPLTLGGSP